MKKVLTFTFLFTCLKLSAAIPGFGIDTPKISATGSNHDTLNILASVQQPDSVKLNAIIINADSLSMVIIPKISSNYLILTSLIQLDSLKASLLEEQAGNNKFMATSNSADSLSGVIGTISNNSSNSSASIYIDNLPPVTSLIQLDSLKESVLAEQVRQAMLKKLMLHNEQLKIAELLKINDLDSLKQLLEVTANDTLKAFLYTRIASKYLSYDTTADGDKKYYDQNEALSYTLKALHEYSSLGDSTGLRSSYDKLAKIYYAQKKYTQAKWFILQSNTLARASNDTPDIITSLLTLAAIKSDIKDYSLARRDLDEALQLSISKHTPKTELQVLKNYALLYNTIQDYPKEAFMLKKRDSLLDSMRKSDEALVARTAAQKKRLDLLNKKKLLSANLRRPYKNGSQAKIASL